MAEDNNVKIKRWKPMSKRPIERPKIRWEDDVLEDIKRMNVRNWSRWRKRRRRRRRRRRTAVNTTSLKDAISEVHL
jgi:hypothetical protein